MNDLFINVTRDGSNTLFHSGIDGFYHSIHGALAESMHVFIKSGLSRLATTESIKVLEVGFGTGLNALLAAQWALKEKKSIQYTALETCIVPKEIWKNLGYPELLDWDEANSTFESIHISEWNVASKFNPYFSLQKLHTSFHHPESFASQANDLDIVFFDAFAPSKQADMWDIEGFKVLFELLKKEGFLVTYCAKGVVKRNLKAAGFTVFSLPGPPRKREMTLAQRSSRD